MATTDCAECPATFEVDDVEIQEATCPNCGHESFLVPLTDLML